MPKKASFGSLILKMPRWLPSFRMPSQRLRYPLCLRAIEARCDGRRFLSSDCNSAVSYGPGWQIFVTINLRTNSSGSPPRFQRFVGAREHFIHKPFHDPEEQFLLALYVAIDTGGAQAEIPREIAHRGAVVAVTNEKLRCPVVDPAPGADSGLRRFRSLRGKFAGFHRCVASWSVIFRPNVRSERDIDRFRLSSEHG